MKLFQATLVTDVHYKDFHGACCTQKAGTLVTVEQRSSDVSVSLDTNGNIIHETAGSYIATFGDIAFDINRLQFQAVS